MLLRGGGWRRRVGKFFAHAISPSPRKEKKKWKHAKNSNGNNSHAERRYFAHFSLFSLCHFAVVVVGCPPRCVMLIQRARNNTDFREKKSFVFFKKRSCGVRWCFSFSVSVFAISCLPPPPPSDADSRVSFLFWDFAQFFFRTRFSQLTVFAKSNFGPGF